MRVSIAFAVLALFASSASAQVGASQRARRSYQPEYELDRRQSGASQRARRSFIDDDDTLDRRQSGASQRARRSLVLGEDAPRRCPASHTVCVVAGSIRGFECVDTSSSLEQCGGCEGAGGVDCTSLPGVEAIGCVQGLCEIWACAEGHAWDATSAACAVSLA